MKQWLMDFLHGLEDAVPPSSKRHHAITAARYGSDDSGWDDRLALQVSRGEGFQTLFLDEDDFLGTPQELITDVVAILNETPKQPNA